MNEPVSPVKTGRSFAALENVRLCLQLVNRLITRDPGLPGIGVFHGPSGYGKSYGSIQAQNTTRAVYIQVGESWNRRFLLQSILIECYIDKPRGTVADLMRQVIVALGENPTRPLIIDEADKLVDKGMIELVREIYEHAQVPVLLIGEEDLPRKLQQIERVHNRVLEWRPAVPVDLDDCRKLAGFFLPGLTVSDELLDKARREGEGRARRVVTTLSDMKKWARLHGAQNLTSETYGGPFCNGRPPASRNLPRKLLRVAGGEA